MSQSALRRTIQQQEYFPFPRVNRSGIAVKGPTASSSVDCGCDLGLVLGDGSGSDGSNLKAYMTKRLIKPPFTVTISVDGVMQDPRGFWHHAQDDPYPGERRYEILYESSTARDLFPDFPQTVTSRLTKSEANWYLHWLYFSLAEPGSELPFAFVLNTIDSVETTGSSVRITGECSLFVRDLPFKSPQPPAA